MNLVLDFGNTRVKAALFDKQKLTEHKIYRNAQELINDQFFYGKARHIIVGTVTEEHQFFIDSIKDKESLLIFESHTLIPLKNLYKSASTLGSDRIAASVGAWAIYPNQNVLTIDAGTCIKYNFVNSENEYLGGAISPGISMRLKALNHYTSRLPLIEPDFNYEKLTGESTRESILSGALMGAVCEVDEMISRYHVEYENLVVVLTGGDSGYLSKQLKNRIFANPDLVLAGLNTILNFNIEK